MKFHKVLAGRTFFHHGSMWVKFPVIETFDGKYNAAALGSGALIFVGESTEVEGAVVRLGNGKINLNDIL